MNSSLNKHQRAKTGMALIGVLFSCLFIVLTYLGPDEIQCIILSVFTKDAVAQPKKGSASADAFSKAYSVLIHPRCMNCHPAGNKPLVGDDSSPHPMQVERGPKGLGQNGLRCGTCHQNKNLTGLHMPPGGPGWQLPPSDMPMVFEKRTARQLCEQMKDPAKNGGRSPRQIVELVRSAPFIQWAWKPGDGRTPVPIPYEDFVRYMTQWAEQGAACPEQ